MENFLLSVLLLLLVGRTLGQVFQRFGFQSLIGEVLAGLILGPILLFIYAPFAIAPTTELSVLSQFGVLMLMLLAGLMTDYKVFKQNRDASIFVGVLGVLFTFLIILLPMQYVIGPMYGLSTMANIFIAVILSNTAIEISAGVLLHSKRPKLRSVIIGASFVDDILAVFMIGIVSSQLYHDGTPTWNNVIILAVLVIIFLVVSLVVASVVIEKLFDKLIGSPSKMTLTATLIVAFLFAIIASLIGLHEVIGAYIAGLIIGKWGEHIGPMLKRRIAWEKLKSDIDTPLRAIFGPLFFGFIGLSVVITQANDFLNIIPLILILVLLAILGKIIGCGLGAKIYRFQSRESWAIGCAMCGRGALELVLLSFGRSIELINDTIFTALVMVTILTVIITPLIYTLSERKIKT